jgi:hypothetical protein
MSELSNLELEGRLNAQREVLGMLIARIATDDGRLLDALRGTIAVQNHQEDPGALPHQAYAVEAAMMREFELILEIAARHGPTGR